MFGKDNKAVVKALGVQRTEWEIIIYKWDNYSLRPTDIHSISCISCGSCL